MHRIGDPFAANGWLAFAATAANGWLACAANGWLLLAGLLLCTLCDTSKCHPTGPEH